MGNLLRIEEAAVRLSMSYGQLRYLMDQGKIKATKVGARSIRIDEDELERYLAELAATPKGE